MGKTTTIKTIMGMLPARAARQFRRQALRPGAHKHRPMGIGLVPEGRRVFGSLSVEENLIATARNTPRGLDVGRVFDLFPRLKERRANPPAPCPAANSRCSPSAARS
jgi:branched-chain amino acid transport system ATP-binding protein